MELEIPRLDETLGINSLQWSADGVLAIATHSNVVLYVPDAMSLFTRHKPEFSRVHIVDLDSIPLSPYLDDHMASLSARRPITDISWSPSGQTQARGCFLAVLSSRGDALIFESRGKPTLGTWTPRINISELLKLTSELHCIHWSSRVYSDKFWPQAVLAVGSENKIHLVDTGDNSFEPRIEPVELEGSPVLLRWNYPRLAIVFSNNSVAVYDDKTKHITQVMSGSRLLVQDVFWVSDQLIVVQPNKITPGPVSFDFDFAGPAFGLTFSEKQFAILTQDANIYSSDMDFWRPVMDQLAKKKLQGSTTRLTGFSLHPFGGLLAILLNSSPSNDWRAPIPSQLSSKLVLIALGGPRGWSVIDGAPSTLWLEQIISQNSVLSLSEWLQDEKEPCVNFELALRQLARSLDKQRFQLWKGEKEAELNIRAQVASLVVKFAELDPSLNATDEDKACVASYRTVLSCEQEDQVMKLQGSFFEEKFIFKNADAPAEIVSVEGRRWKRCASTLLPILGMDTRVSEDEQYTSLTPESHNSPLVGAILRAFDYCIYTGSRWYLRQFNDEPV